MADRIWKELKQEEIQGFLSFGSSVVKQMRPLIAARSAAGFQTEVKGDGTPVTEVDKAVETRLREEILRRFPDCGIIGEEFENHNPQAKLQWVIDPIDGTSNFACGIPTYGVILALHYCSEQVVGCSEQVIGIVDHPMLDLHYSAARGLGAFENGRRIEIRDLSSARDWRREIFCLSSRRNFVRSGDEQIYDFLIREIPCVRHYDDIFAHTRSIAGQTGASLSVNVRKWDIAATQVLVEEAGGKFVWLRESELKPGVATYTSLFGKPSVVDHMLGLLSQTCGFKAALA